MRSAAAISVHPYLHRFRPVVFALKERSAAAIADALDCGRLRGDVENSLTAVASTTATQPRHDLVDRQIVIQHRVERNPAGFHLLLQQLGLPDRPRESVEYEAAAAV